MSDPSLRTEEWNNPWQEEVSQWKHMNFDEFRSREITGDHLHIFLPLVCHEYRRVLVQPLQGLLLMASFAALPAPVGLSISCQPGVR